MTVVSMSGLAKSYGDRTLFEGVTLRLEPGDRYGLVGANGSGKTTLLNILAGRDQASLGKLTLSAGCRIGVLHQDRYMSDEQPIIEVAMMGDELVWELLQEQSRLLGAGEHDTERQAAAIADIEDKILAADGYTLESRAGTVLEGLGIEAETHRQPLSTLSGGFKLRVLLAQTLVGQPDLLLLDEPTNHLDILTIRWLEKFFCDYRGCVVVISHDHRFLDNVASHILDVDYQTVTLYHGNYGAFVEQKQQTRERMETEIARVEKEIAHKKSFVERFRYKNTKARQAQSRLKQIEKLEIPELVQSSRRRPHFRFEQTRKSGKDVLSTEGLHKSYGDLHVLTDVSLKVRRNERVGVIGANGLGKSTLLKILVDRLDADLGSLEWGHETSVGYFPQNHAELLEDANQTALDYLWSICPQQTTSFVRGQLGRVLFSGEDVEKKLRSLSGGEAARLIFSRLAVGQPNVLVLDEPTNHLDIESIEALVDALLEFEGTLLFVSHDRWFVSQLATRIMEVTASGLHDYPGSYDDYLAHCGDDHLDAATVLRKARAENKSSLGDATHKEGNAWRDQKKVRARQRKLLADRDRVTAAIEEAEKRQAEIQQRYCEPGFFEQTPADEVSALQAEEAALPPRIEELMAAWEQVEEELAKDG